MRLTVVIILSPWERPKAGQRAVAAATLALIQPTEEARLWVSIAPPRPMAPPRLPTTTQRSLRHGIAGPQPLRSFKRCPTIREATARRPSDMPNGLSSTQPRQKSVPALPPRREGLRSRFAIGRAHV